MGRNSLQGTGKETNETFPPGLAFEEAAMHIAHQKALAVKGLLDDDTIILAADTIVVCEGALLGKPVDKQDAVRILSLLQGHTHEVITGVSILKGETEHQFFDRTAVEFHPLTEEQLYYYVEKYKPYDKAGAYAIQEWIGVVGIKSIKGDFYNVMGLPVSRVVQELEKLAEIN